MKRHVMVIEDEPTLLRGLLRGLESLPDLRVTGCGSVEQAIPVLRLDPPELLITDINLPGRPGLEMISELDRIGLRIPVIVITAFRAAYAGRIPSEGVVTVLEKPVPLKDLRRMIVSELDLDTPRPVGAFQLVDYLQMAGFGRHSVILEVSYGDDEVGIVEVVEGDVWNAYYRDLVGQEAVAVMLRRPARGVAAQPLERRPSRRQLDGGWEGLLLELARLEDEERGPGA